MDGLCGSELLGSSKGRPPPKGPSAQIIGSRGAWTIRAKDYMSIPLNNGEDYMSIPLNNGESNGKEHGK